MNSSDLYIGLMSGTSMDGIDAVLVDFAQGPLKLLATHTLPWSLELKQRLVALSRPGENELDRMGSLHVELGGRFAEAALAVIQKADIDRSLIAAIGSHGQTVRHRPAARFPFTIQIGDPNTIAELTGITTVADFRQRDIAAGGQGAPLVPAFHAALFRDAHVGRAVVNIGGMANISLLPAGVTLPVTGFDTGPGNVLMDSWIERQRHCPMDEDGDWAASGTVDSRLLSRLLNDPYFQMPPPKSTGREYFNLEWLLNQLHGHERAEDVQATLCELTARTIAEAVTQSSAGVEEVLVCGGGAYNAQLMSRLSTLNSGKRVSSTDDFGLAPRWVEATAFAWLARQTVLGRPGNLPEVTGASHPVILGALWPG